MSRNVKSSTWNTTAVLIQLLQERSCETLQVLPWQRCLIWQSLLWRLTGQGSMMDAHLWKHTYIRAEGDAPCSCSLHPTFGYDFCQSFGLLKKSTQHFSGRIHHSLQVKAAFKVNNFPVVLFQIFTTKVARSYQTCQQISTEFNLATSIFNQGPCANSRTRHDLISMPQLQF